ncbi:hypothetical protein BU15DRAFT_82363 [Melanogaster broomeanus]|nr:hypothetical protein BU15DRAFT_82363 [Melanogaster broomeanus]
MALAPIVSKMDPSPHEPPDHHRNGPVNSSSPRKWPCCLKNSPSPHNPTHCLSYGPNAPKQTPPHVPLSDGARSAVHPAHITLTGPSPGPALMITIPMSRSHATACLRITPTTSVTARRLKNGPTASKTKPPPQEPPPPLQNHPLHLSNSTSSQKWVPRVRLSYYLLAIHESPPYHLENQPTTSGTTPPLQ